MRGKHLDGTAIIYLDKLALHQDCNATTHHLPPRRARTRCSTDPATMFNSLAVLSSCLSTQKETNGQNVSTKAPHPHAHLTPTENEPLLGRRYARLFLHLFLYPRDLNQSLHQSPLIPKAKLKWHYRTLSSASMSSSIYVQKVQNQRPTSSSRLDRERSGRKSKYLLPCQCLLEVRPASRLVPDA